MAVISTYRFLSDLLDTLAADGFDMGIGRHLQVQELLSKLPEDLPLASLKTLLAPLFATNRQDQERFYELFDQALHREAIFQESFVTPVPNPLPPEVKQVYLWRNVVLALLAALAGVAGLIFDTVVWSTWLLAIGVAAFAAYFAIASLSSWNRRIWYWASVVLLGIFGYFFKAETIEPPPGKAFYQPFPVTPGEAHHLPISLREDSLLDITFFNQTKRDTNEVLGILQIDAPDSTCCFTLVAQDSFPRSLNDTIIVLNVYPNFSDTTYFIAQYQKPAEAAPVVNEPDIAELDTLPIPYPRDISELYVDAKLEARAAFYRQYAWIIKLALSLLFGGILWAIVQWRERKRRRLVAELDRQDRPPYVWNLKIENTKEITFSEAIPLLLNQLRRRRFSEAFRLDVPRTVTATVRSAGRVDFKFKQLTSPPDYLLLIDRHNHSDHRALLFNRLYEVFRANEVTIERFYYQGDPRLCFNEAHPDGIGLKELQHRFGEARLLLVGNGYDVLSPLSGKPAKWVNIFSNWRERALFSPQPLGTWGRKEAALGDLFYLMPASIEGFTATLDEFGSTDPRQPSELIAKLEDVPWRPIELDVDLLQTLRLHYPEKILQWIAACAVYPTLNWDLTLHLGRELSTEAEPLLTLDNLFALTRLPWFIEGHIPDAAREELIAYLQQAGMENRVRESLHRLFEQTPQPAADSVAYEDYRVSALTNELLFTTSRLRRRKLRAELDRYLAAGTEPDVVNFKYLQACQRSAVDFVVPEKWKAYFSKTGNVLGGWKDWMWAVPIWVILAGVMWWYQPDFGQCNGNKVIYNGQLLCLESLAENLTYFDHRVKNAIRTQNLAAADTLVALIPLATDTTPAKEESFSVEATILLSNQTVVMDLLIPATSADVQLLLANSATYYYNNGATLYNQLLQIQDSIQKLSENEVNRLLQQSNTIGFLNPSNKDKALQNVTDLLTKGSCDNFTRGYALYQQLPDTTRAKTRDVGLSFELAMQRVCVDTASVQQASKEPVSNTLLPTNLPPVSYTVVVVDNETGRYVRNAEVRALNGLITGGATRVPGNYRLEVPGALKDSILSVRFNAEGYRERTIALRMSGNLDTVRLEKLPVVVEKPPSEVKEQETRVGSFPIIYVKAGSNGDGSSWDNAMGDLQQALKTVQKGNQIWVAAGKYIPTKTNDRTISFNIPDGIELYGGFAGSERDVDARDWKSNLTILSGEIGTSAINDNSYSIIFTENVSEATFIDGFVITSGAANGSNSKGEIERCGGGWYNRATEGDSNPTISNCVFENNFARDGAGFYNIAQGGTASPLIQNCQFISNRADLDGGAIYINGTTGDASAIIDGCTFERNEATYGAGIFINVLKETGTKMIISNCNFIDNYSYIRRNSIYNYGNSDPVIKNNRFVDNDGYYKRN